MMLSSKNLQRDSNPCQSFQDRCKSHVSKNCNVAGREMMPDARKQQMLKNSEYRTRLQTWKKMFIADLSWKWGWRDRLKADGGQQFVSLPVTRKQTN